MQGTTSQARSQPAAVHFDRRELDRLLQLYGFFVARGDWKDYAIDGLSDRAVFSVFRRAAEAPLYRIEKNPKLRNRQGAWSVVSMSGQVLKRGHELEQVLRVFDSKKLKVVS
ncbi:DUF2794 domain-containing protein [Parvularcula lutaonensis]|uniref:DUF2794 domain-containing protein n=1 Tax=Parvularcula lutaonensis TaxID=491923 RepID=A0ABV7MAU8_9PROT|nr:DUF2794 domain-containing protein [Parvularcula lutaonensis]GGY47682.1 hypothetical protein GCM10007148_16360 [Parvularcula lutaonensis]